MPTITLEQLCAHCMQLGQECPASFRRYVPSAQQLTFFSLVWAAKEGAAVKTPAELVVHKEGQGYSGEDVHAQMAQIAMYLEGDGEQVANLKRLHASEWELLRIQLANSLKGVKCPAEWKDEAVSMTLERLLALVAELPRPRDLESKRPIFAFAAELQASAPPSKRRRRAETGGLCTLYRFHAVFIAYAKKVVVNKLRDLMRHANHFTETDLSDEAMAERLQAADEIQHVGEQEELRAAEAAQVEHLALLLQQLMFAIETELTPKQRVVMLETLAARPQFWRALTLVEREAPKGFTQPEHAESDAEIAARLGLTENAVRVHRAGAKKRLAHSDPATDSVPILARLLDVLLDARSGLGS
jgi:DNA-directed RNA polymerase specialized sigma24 family protein